MSDPRARRMPNPDLTRAKLFRLLALLWIGGVAIRLPILAIPPILPLIHADLHLSETQVGLLVGLPLALFALAAVAGSLLVSRLGVRLTMMIGLIFTALASASRSLSIDALTLYAATAATAAGVAVMQPALPALVRTWVPDRIGLGTAVYTNGMIIGSTTGPALTIPLMLPFVGGSWRLALVAWSGCVVLVACAYETFAPRSPARTQPDAPPHLWWPDWRNPLIWQLALAFGGTNALFFGANAFLPDLLVAEGRADLIAGALGWLNGSQLFTSFSLLWLADRVHRRAWPYLVFGPLALAAVVAIVSSSGGWIVLAAGVLGATAAVPFVLALALPAALSAPGDVHRTAAGMFSISYAGAVIVPIISGAIWDLSGAAWSAFVPLGLCTVVMTLVGAWLSRRGAGSVVSA
jgi:MFS transporter, CP family, cyanate transporter